jgi:DNA-3-methyladenine glycosylase II
MKIDLKPVAPYDFEFSAEIFSGGDNQIRNYQQGKLHQILRVDGKLILITVNSAGTIDKPLVEVELKSDTKIDEDDELKAQEIISSVLNLQLDLNPFYKVAREDPVMTVLVQKLRGLKSPVTSTPFEALIDSIIEQQISLKAAHGLERNLIKKFGDTLTLNGNVYYAYPTAQNLNSASLDDLRKCGLSLRKSEYVQGISENVSLGELNLDSLKDYAVDDAIKELDKIRGIGVWTAELTLVRGMGKLEAIPADDIGVRRVISHYYFHDRRISSDETRQVASKWGEWKGLASFYLIMAEIKGIKL